MSGESLPRRNLVQRARASQRRNHRISAPLSVTIGDTSYHATNWSVSGCLVRGCNQMIPDDCVEDVVLTLPFHGYEISVKTRGSAKRYEPETRSLALEYLDLDDRGKAVLEHFAKGLISGEMVPFEDTIKHIDAPTTPASIPGLAGADKRTNKRPSGKQILLGSIYALGGAALALYILGTLYAHLYVIKVDTAILNAPVEELASPVNGLVDDIFVHAGEFVSAKDPILRVTDQKMTDAIEMARLGLRKAEMNLQEQQSKLAAEQEKMGRYASFSKTRLSAAQAKAESLEKQVAIARRQFDRVQQFQAQGVYSRIVKDEAETKYLSLVEAFKVANADLEIASEALTAAKSGYFFNDQRLEGKLPELQASVATWTRKVELERHRFTYVQQGKDGVTMRAPFSGKVLKINRSVGNTVRSNKPLILLERTEATVVDAYLTPSEVGSITIGQDATVYIPALRISQPAVVVNIDSTTDVDYDVRKSYTWGSPSESRTARVRLQLAELGQGEVPKSLATGLPVSVRFSSFPGAGIVGYQPAARPEGDTSSDTMAMLKPVSP